MASFIKDYQNGKKIYEWDGRYIKSYQTGSKSLEIDRPIPIAIIIGIATGMI